MMDNKTTNWHPIELLRLSERPYNALLKNNICYIEELIKIEDDLTSLSGMGQTGSKEIEDKLMIAKSFLQPHLEERKIEINTLHPSRPFVTQSEKEPDPYQFTSFTHLMMLLIDGYYRTKTKAFNQARNRSVIIQRFLGRRDRKEQRTLQSIGDEFGITRERVRQVCHEFLVFSKLTVSQNPLLKECIDKVLAEARNSCVFDLKGLIGIVQETLPQIEENEMYDFIHFLGYWSDIKDVTDVISPGKDEAIFCLGEHCANVYKVIDLIGQLFSKGIHLQEEIVDCICKELNCNRQMVLSTIQSSSRFAKSHGYIFRRSSSKRLLSVADMLYVVFKSEKRSLHFENAASFIWEYFNEDILPHHAQSAMLADRRFERVGFGTYALFEPGMIRGKTEDVIQAFLRKKGEPANFREIANFVRKHRVLSDGGIMLGITRSKKIIQIKRGSYGLRKWGDSEIVIERKQYLVPMYDGVYQILKDASSPVSVDDISKCIQDRFGEKCSFNKRSIVILLDVGSLKSIVNKTEDNLYSLKEKQIHFFGNLPSDPET